jgi:hypothetical protein
VGLPVSYRLFSGLAKNFKCLLKLTETTPIS